MTEMANLFAKVIGLTLLWLAVVVLALVGWAVLSCRNADAASQPKHVRFASRYLPVGVEPTPAEPQAEPLTWQQEWQIQRSILIAARGGFPIDLPE